MTEWAFITVAVLVVLVTVSALLVRRTVRRARRRLGAWQRRVLELRGYLLPPGPRRDAARLRGRLDAELRATREMLQHAPHGLIFRADAAAVLADLTSTAADLDGELSAIERFLDPAQQQQALTSVSAQVEDLITATYTARHTILRTAGQDRAKHLAALRDDIAAQATAADRYRQTGRELNL